MRTPELVLLGGPNSGKTHYAGQLYGRLQRSPGLLKLRKDQGTPPDLTALEEVLNSLANGNAADHTSADTWVEVLLPLVDDQGHGLDLRWPDYGGEQLMTVFERRMVPEAWRSRLSRSEGWLLLIRLKGETIYPDTLEGLTKRSEEHNGAAARPGTWDANARWVELLQILLHVAGLGTVPRLQTPRLTVMLSCYDELSTNDLLPREVLAKHLPLVASFIDSIWTPDAVSVWGLSALGCLLEKNSENENFIDEGPEYQGWIIGPEGGLPDPDLSRPLAWLLGTR